MSDIILASQSPRRKQLLEAAEIVFTVEAADIAELHPPEMKAYDVPEFLSREKAAVISERKPHAIVIAADTIVLLDNVILGKPTDEADAIRMLGMLSGRRHEVVSGVCVRKGAEAHAFSVVTEVFFRSLSSDAIRHYVERYRPYDKAGGYAIQEWIGMTGIERINGDYYNVMGLPIGQVVPVIHRFMKEH